MRGTAVDMEPGCLTQVFALNTDNVTVSNISMSVGTPRPGDRVGNLPETTARKKTNGNGGRKRKAAKAPSADREPRRPNMQVNARVVVERQYIHLRVPH